jgi:hypothetical protein
MAGCVGCCERRPERLTMWSVLVKRGDLGNTEPMQFRVVIIS